MLTQEQLAFLRFPLGELRKEEARAIADEAGLVNARKHESQDICFIPDSDYGAFLERRTGRRAPEGDILDLSGRVIGRHRGAVRYTIGQRRGLGVAAEQPLYVAAKDMARNTVTLGPESALYSRELTASDFNWLSIPEPDRPIRAAVRTRYRQAEAPPRFGRLGIGRSGSFSTSRSAPSRPARRSSSMTAISSSAAGSFLVKKIEPHFDSDYCLTTIRAETLNVRNPLRCNGLRTFAQKCVKPGQTPETRTKSGFFTFRPDT